MYLVLAKNMEFIFGKEKPIDTEIGSIKLIWRLEMVTVNNHDFVLTTNYATLFSYLIPAFDRPKFLIALSSKLKCGPVEFRFRKDINRSVMGSMNDMKRMMVVWSNRFDHTSVGIMEDKINETPFSYLKWASPSKSWAANKSMHRSP